MFTHYTYQCAGLSFPDFPLSQVRTKLELARGLLAVLEVVEPGLSKPRAKVIFELVDTELYLLCQQLQAGRGRGGAAQLKGDRY